MIYSILEKFRNKNHVIWSSYAKDMRETSIKKKRAGPPGPTGPSQPGRPRVRDRSGCSKKRAKSVLLNLSLLKLL